MPPQREERFDHVYIINISCLLSPPTTDAAVPHNGVTLTLPATPTGITLLIPSSPSKSDSSFTAEQPIIPKDESEKEDCCCVVF